MPTTPSYQICLNFTPALAEVGPACSLFYCNIVVITFTTAAELGSDWVFYLFTRYDASKLSPIGEVVGSLDTQEHIKTCEGYEHLRTGKNLDTDKDLVNYFYSVIRKRMGLS